MRQPSTATRRVARHAIVAQSWGSDLIVFGRHGRNGFHPQLKESVTDGVTHLINIPVLPVQKASAENTCRPADMQQFAGAALAHSCLDAAEDCRYIDLTLCLLERRQD